MQIYFRPKQLLASILTIYIQIFQADHGDAFVTGIAADSTSYRPEYFVEASRIASEVGLPGFGANECRVLRGLTGAADKAQQEQKVCSFALFIATIASQIYYYCCCRRRRRRRFVVV
jgi:hypothetical protein